MIPLRTKPAPKYNISINCILLYFQNGTADAAKRKILMEIETETICKKILYRS